MRCLACSSEVQDSAKFCGQCGATIGRDLENNVSKVAQDISEPDSNGLLNGVERLENLPAPTIKSKEVRSSEKILESEPFWQSMKPFYYGALLALVLALVGALYSYLPSISATLTRVSTTTNMVKNIIMGVKEEKIIYEFNSYYKNERSLADWAAQRMCSNLLPDNLDSHLNNGWRIVRSREISRGAGDYGRNAQVVCKGTEYRIEKSRGFFK